MTENEDEKYVIWFDELRIEDVPLVGGKNASLGEMYHSLKEKGVLVPNGFAITAAAYRHLLKDAGIEEAVREALEGLDTHDIRNLQERGRKVREIIRYAKLPDDLEVEIREAYRKLCEEEGTIDVDVAVRSSATAEDLPDASFAGQQETYLNIRGEESLLYACRSCFASLFTNRAISYREDKGFGHFDVYLSIGVQLMVRSDAAAAGVIFSIDTESGFKDAVFITGAYGLGENVVQGAINPDEFYVFKPTLEGDNRPIIGKRLGSKEEMMVYTSDQRRPTKNVDTPESMRHSFCISDDEILQLARWSKIIEDHYGKPMDIEWAKNGDGDYEGDGKLYIVQARPETVHSQKATNVIETFVLAEKGKILVTGQAVGSKIGQGKVNVIEKSSRIHEFKKGEVLVTDMTDPDWEPIMKIASAIVTNRGGRTCHAAIVSRELGIPAVIGTENATKVLKDDMEVTVSCAEGQEGVIFEGILPFNVERILLDEMPKTRTKIMMNVGIPEKAFDQGQIPNDGVGLAREEFIINSYIGIHPLALHHYRELKEKAETDGEIREIIRKIDEKTSAYEDKEEFFIENLAMGIGRIAAGFYPNDVVVRLSDFKTNEYANLIGGSLYEPDESNPMIGWRGASRYYDPSFKPAFIMECKAIKRVRDEMGLTNVISMIPFCRTVEEGRKVIAAMAEAGLKQGENGLEVYVMAEIPSNVIEADGFAEVFDGFSIGSNDLTQLALGLDRDSELVAHIYDERDTSVKRLVKSVIDTAKEKGKKIGICGQAPSDFPEFATFLVECGIDSMSLNPDTVVKTKLDIAKKEKELGIQP
ncbi:MAG: phosphoenolpyruvate synthase [Candidatus Heimdallarchaeota archaeon]|nr:MAG: phosphoenolpyruvate synthase [Candidatus Heimdallarchaeota archaeon]